MKIIATNRNIALVPEDEDEVDDLILFQSETAYRAKGYRHDHRFIMGVWDGKKNLIKKIRSKRGPYGEWRAPVGLLDEVIAEFGAQDVIDDRSPAGPSLPIEFNPGVIASTREYQDDAADAFVEDRGILTGKGMLRLPTRSGKTVIAGRVITRLGVKTLFIVPSQLLLNQTVEFFREALRLSTRKGKLVRKWEKNLVGQFGGGVLDPGWITVASVQSICAHWQTKRVQNLLANSGLIIFDECFAAGTPVRTPDGTKPIETLQAGDSVRSFDESTGEFVTRKVVRTYKSKSSIVYKPCYRVAVAGEAFIVTYEHPWLTTRGWVTTSTLEVGDLVRLDSDSNQGWGRVERSERVDDEGHVYNLEVEQTHTYLVGDIGAVVHNCHHLTGDTWRSAMLKSDARYKLGLSATIDAVKEREMSDGAVWLVAATGPVLFSLQPSQLIREGWLCRPEIRFVDVPDAEGVDDASGWHDLYRGGIVENERRNEAIADIAKKHVLAGERVLITMVQVKHTKIVVKALKEAGLSVAQITGGTKTKDRARLVEQFANASIDVMIGTVFGEGVDLPWLDTVIIGGGMSSTTLTLQRLRNLTPYDKETKKARRTPMETPVVVVVYDFADFSAKILANHSRTRLATYAENKAFRVVWQKLDE